MWGSQGSQATGPTSSRHTQGGGTRRVLGRDPTPNSRVRVEGSRTVRGSQQRSTGVLGMALRADREIRAGVPMVVGSQAPKPAGSGHTQAGQFWERVPDVTQESGRWEISQAAQGAGWEDPGGPCESSSPPGLAGSCHSTAGPGHPPGPRRPQRAPSPAGPGIRTGPTRPPHATTPHTGVPRPQSRPPEPREPRPGPADPPRTSPAHPRLLPPLPAPAPAPPNEMAVLALLRLRGPTGCGRGTAGQRRHDEEVGRP